MRPIRSVSVLVPTYQGIEFLERQLAALARQRFDRPWDFTAIDSGSTDGTWELLQAWKAKFPVPLAPRRIHKVEFDHGDTRNQLAAHTSGDLCVYLTQDAIPIADDWLAQLTANFDDARVAAAYCRNVPRQDASPLTRLLSRDDPGYAAGRREVRLSDAAAYAAMTPHERRVLYNFNDVASAVRRELWERHPFPRTPFGEDVLMARALLEAGFTVVYDDAATVEHSHDYGPEETLARAEIDGRFNAEWLDRVCIESPADAEACAEREFARDVRSLGEFDLAGPADADALARLRRLRGAMFTGLHAGGRSMRRRASSRVRDERALSILFVVHGFPPHTWAGTEVYTLNLAQALAARGHRVTILARAPEPEGALERRAELAEDEFDGLRVLRWARRLEGATIAESYREPRAEAMFRALLARERPDVIHFQHLIHLSTHLVHVARELAVPSVITCHDYWSICARVQLIRPDAVRCERNMGSGCFLCTREESLGAIEALADLDRRSRLAPVSIGAAAFAERERAVLGAYRAADLRISPSRFLRQKLVDTAGFEPESFVFSDNGMRTDHVRAPEKESDRQGRLRFGFVGSLVWYKGGEVMLKAMRRLDAREERGESARGRARAVLNVYGDFRPDRDAHHAELRDIAGESVSFRGRFDNARLSEVYAEIDVLLVPSIWYENSPVTIHEAFLTRTPVIASDIGGMAEYVRDDVEGLQFRAGDDADLAAKMERLLDDPALVERLSRAAGARGRELKTIEADAREMEFRYRGLACRLAVREAPVDGRPVLVERVGTDTASCAGAVEPQGARAVLVRPGGAVEYAISGAGGGRRRVEITQWIVAGEPELVLAGRVSIDAREVGRIATRRTYGVDERCTHVFEVEIDPGAARLRLESGAPDAPDAHLRIVNVAVLIFDAAESHAERRAEDAPCASSDGDAVARAAGRLRTATYAALGRRPVVESRFVETAPAIVAEPARELVLRAHDTVARRGAVEPQGPEFLLVRPGGEVEYDLAGAGYGWRTIRVEQVALAGESGLELGGEASIDGRRVAALTPCVSSGVEHRFRRELFFEVPPGAKRLRLSAAPLGDARPACLRIARVVVRATGAEPSLERTSA